MRLDLTLVQLAAVRTMLADEFADDERGYLDMLEGETDALEMARKLLNGIEQDEGDVSALKAQMDARSARKARAEARIKARRAALLAMLETAGVDKLPLPEATITRRVTPDRLAVNDPDAVPRPFQVAKWSPDMDAIKAEFANAETLPNWLRVEPGRPSLTSRSK